MEINDASLIMIAFSTFVIALLTYIANNTRESKNPPQGLAAKGGFLSFSA
ncbi:putative holin-like toxin [Paenibacillus sp. TH7-28]